MKVEDKKLLLSEIINCAQEIKNYTDHPIARVAVSRIVRLSKRLYVDAIKTKEEKIEPAE